MLAILILQVVVRDQQRRQKSRVARIQEYFYGPRGDLSPHSTVISFRSVRIFKVGVGRSNISLSHQWKEGKLQVQHFQLVLNLL